MVNKKKVIFFVNAYAGGAEKMTLNIAGFLKPENYDVVFYIIGKDCGSIINFIPANLPVHYIKINSYKDNLIFKLIKAIREEKPDYVFSSLMPINWRLCLAASLFTKTKTIIRINNYLYTQSFIQKIRLFISYRFARKIIVQTREMLQEHISQLRLDPNNVITLANPVNVRSIQEKIGKGNFHFKDNDALNFVFVGRLDPVKGLDILLKAFSKVQKEEPKAVLHIVGKTDGIFQEYYHSLLALCEELDISEVVLFHGFQENPYQFIKTADCLVLPSRNEGLPNVIIESLFLGTAVAATRSIPIISRLVIDGVEGFTSEVDDVEGFSDAMIKAVKLKYVPFRYISATPDDFIQLFN